MPRFAQMTVAKTRRFARRRILLDPRISNYHKGKGDFPLRQEMSIKVLTFLILSLAPTAFAEDFKTVNGREYKDATITRVEPDGVVVKTNSGITKLYFTELPKEVQERFHYDSQKAAAYSAQQTANYAARQKEQDETQRQQRAADAKTNAALAEQQAATNRIQGLQTRYSELQKQEDALLLQFGQAKQPGAAYRGGKNGRTLLHQPNPQKSQLPVLQSHLSDVRHEKAEVRKQLEKAQR